MQIVNLLIIGGLFAIPAHSGSPSQAAAPPPGAAQQAAAPSSSSSQQATSPAPSAAKPAADAADMTTATFGDWLLRCRLTETGKPGRSCEVVQTVMIQGQAAPFAQLALGHPASGDPLYFTAVVPPNVTFPSTLRVSFDEKDALPVDVTWTRCLPGGCFASLALPKDVLARWRARDDAGRLGFKNGAGQDATVAISFRGLARALDALAKETAGR
jgi:invasion protein IalB